jgi:hypothetical protein
VAPQLDAPSTDGPATGATAVQPVNGRQPLRTLLYVEDNPANLELVEQLIERRATCACSARQMAAWASSLPACTSPT